jgi:hypothetical protein
MISFSSNIQTALPLRKVARCFILLVVAYNIFSLFAYAFVPQLQTFAFPMLGGFRLLPPFADLRWVTSLSGCGVNLEDLAEGKVFGCDPYGRGGALGYPPLSVDVARLLHVQGGDTGIMGFTMGLALIGILLGLLFHLLEPGWRRDLLGGFILISFPVQTALERSNIDLIIFLLLTSLAASIATSRRWLVPLTAFISWLTVGIKLYPIAGITVWFGLSIMQRPRFSILRTASLFGASLGFVSALPWFITHGKDAAQPAAGFISHGLVVPLPMDVIANRAPLLAKLVQFVPGTLIAFLIFIVTFIFCLKIQLSFHWEELLLKRAKGYPRRFLSIMPAVLCSVWLGCFFLSGSFDYRLIFAYPAFICLLALLDCSHLKMSTSYRVCLLLVTAAGFISFLLPLLWFSDFLLPKWILFWLLLFCDLFLMPFFAGAIASIALPISVNRSSI